MDKIFLLSFRTQKMLLIYVKITIKQYYLAICVCQTNFD